MELMPGRSAEAAGDRLTAVVLGASNVSRGLARLSAAIRGREAGPVGLFVAAGHGRSYGANSRVWLRRLPSILACGLWRALDREAGDGGRRVALVTDIGNDLLYGFPPGQVAAWVREAVDRLVDRGATVAIARLPLEAVRRVGPVRYRALKTLFVPGCPLSMEGIHSAAADLDGRIAELAALAGLATIHQPGEWYGFDTLHPRRRRLDTLWHHACDAWGLPPAPRPTRAGFREWSRLGRRAAEVRQLGRQMRYTPQPIRRYADGGWVALY
jgi:hypothetical protein